MLYMIKAMGIKQVETKFARMAEARLAAHPALDVAALEMMRIIEQTFQSQGRRGGGSWKRDSADWLASKQRQGLDPRIGHATLALRESMTVPEAAGQVLEVTNFSVSLGSELPYAQTAQRNRPFVKFTVRDRARLRNIVRDYLIGAFNAA